MTVLARKADFYRLWYAGVLGNKPRIWKGLWALMLSDFRGEVTIRSSVVKGWGTMYRVPYAQVGEAVSAYGNVDDFTFNESMPDEVLTLQGEVMRGEDGLYARWDATPGLKMKEAMAVAKDARGLAAKLLLDRHLWPSSRDDLDALLDLYPGHVIEFSCYDRAVGDQSHRNTIIWEVRRY